jgi:DNA mismatch repair ATPase MutS
VYLAHIGSYVPADSAVMGVVDSIHTRIQTVESITKELSAFTLDLRQVITSKALQSKVKSFNDGYYLSQILKVFKTG